jgi:hypothetical protein
MEQLMEAPGAAPAWALDPRQNGNEDHDSPIISARFFLGPDPRPDEVGNVHVNEQGEIPVIEMVEIINRNDPKNSPMIQIATDWHRYRTRAQGGFPQEYQAFKKGVEMQSSGIPVKEWLGENSRTKNLENFDIYTVEQLAAISDSLCQTLGAGTYDLRKKAVAYLAFRKDSSVAEKAMAENDALKRQMADMQTTLARLSAHVEQQSVKAPEQHVEQYASEQLPPTPERRGPGRPRVNAGE